MKRDKADKILPVRIGEWDLEQIRIKAERHASGNVSAWVRYASRMYIPKKSERIRIR